MKKILFLIAIIGLMFYACTKDSGTSSETAVDSGAGKGGSMAKFSISNNHLFLINEYQLKVYDITNSQNPTLTSSLDVDFGIETVFTLGDYLFIGSNNGMHIYDISNPQHILYLSFYQHITSCDPVVANDTLAFVTLNSSASCWWQGGANRIDVLDITNKVNPTLLSSLPMNSPKGLGLYDHYVIVCNSEFGVDILDYSNPYYLSKVSGITGINAYDVIVDGDTLILIGQDGLFQYNISDIYQIELISNILFN